MRYFIIAGEQSGDLHGSNLVRGLFAADPGAEIYCWGGDLMEAAGARLLMHYRKIAIMGFTAVIRNLGTISANLDLCKSQIMGHRPDVVIFIDYPGFNLRIAEFAKKSGFTTFYYISPKFWAWNEGRIKKVKKYIDRMFIIFPFEIGFYRKHGIETQYYGNPLVDEITRKKSSYPPEEEIRRSAGLGKDPVIALLAGSRRGEIEYVLPEMLKVVKHFPDYRFVLTGVKNIPDELYKKIIGDQPVTLVKEKTYEILNISSAALVTSGTATLETALHGVPQVVCYKADFFSMLIAWMVIKVKYISLVNLLLDFEAVPELVQYDLRETALVNSLESVLPGGSKRQKMLDDYSMLVKKLGPEGASGRIASEMVNSLKNILTKVKGA